MREAVDGQAWWSVPGAIGAEREGDSGAAGFLSNRPHLGSDLAFGEDHGLVLGAGFDFDLASPMREAEFSRIINGVAGQLDQPGGRARDHDQLGASG